ncbi:MAG: SIS domain-containing protein [Gemmatimonadetes bacterium]|nr:SIS domain-containing protein [Gemmatimonadota bacterium]
MAGSEGSVVREELRALAELASAVAESPLCAQIEAVAALAVGALRGARRLYFCGNGGSAADAQHLAAEYVVRFKRERRGLAALALTTDTSVLTAAGNDYGYQTIFARQVEALGGPGDVLFLHSTSGESENLLLAADAARAIGMVTVAMLAKGGGRLKDRVDHALVVPTTSTAHAQELHLAIGHAICELVDRALSGGA